MADNSKAKLHHAASSGGSGESGALGANGGARSAAWQSSMSINAISWPWLCNLNISPLWLEAVPLMTANIVAAEKQ